MMECAICGVKKEKLSTYDMHERPVDTQYYTGDLYNYRDSFYEVRHNTLCYQCAEQIQYTMPYREFDYTPAYYDNDRFSNNLGKEDTSPYMGVELELNIINHNHFKEVLLYKLGMFLDLHNMYHLFYVKHDGSIPYGIELVSRPMTFNFIKTLPLQKLFTFLKRYFYVSNKTGMHIHVDSRYISEENFFNINNFVFRNRMTMFILSGRARYIENYNERSVTGSQYYAFRSNRRIVFEPGRGKYFAIAIRRGTIEFRLFAGVISYIDFMKNLQVVNALVYLAKQLENNSTRKGITFSNFIDYLEKNNLKAIANSVKKCKEQAIEVLTKAKVV